MKIMIVGGDLSLGRVYKEELIEEGHEVSLLSRGDNLLESIANKKPELLILGVALYRYEKERLKFLEQVKSSFPDLPVIFSTSYFEFSREALATGADFIYEISADVTERKKNN